ncbi:hypothetical protein QNI24_02420 [Marinicella sp. X102]|nr:hypothetical protein [Marinicella marina]
MLGTKKIIVRSRTINNQGDGMFGFFKKKKKAVKRVDKRKRQRRSGQQRREEFRWEEDNKQDRRSHVDRRKGNDTWDETNTK